jgi:lauroyl/myristoyl acyltransferase
MALSVHQSHPAFGFFHPAWSQMPISAVANLGDRKATHSSMLLDGLLKRVELLPTTAAALRPMLARLASGGCVAIYADYLYPDTPGTVSALFGGPVMISSAAVSVALRTGAAVIPVSVARVWPPDSGGVQVQIGTALPLWDLDPRDPASREAAALRFGIAMECLIRRHPSVWRLWATLGHRWQCGEESLAQMPEPV